MDTTRIARHLRCNMTDAERHLWRHLRHRQIGGHKFRRQCPIGPYIADFVCFDQRLIIEVDGGQHQERADADRKRTARLEQLGYRVLRFWNHEVLGETEAVLAAIDRALIGLDHPHPGLPPWGKENADPDAAEN